MAKVNKPTPLHPGTSRQPTKLPPKLRKEGQDKLIVKDAALDDERIPRNLLMKYGDDYYVLKAGLEWKANQLVGGAGYSLILEPVTLYKVVEQGIEPPDRHTFKATLTVIANGAKFVNFGEASKENSNSNMHNNLFHLAATRAECRVLRMATACGYASYEEVRTFDGNGQKSTRIQIEGGDKPATKTQLATIKALDPGFFKVNKKTHLYIDPEGLTKQKASDFIRQLSKK